MAEKETPLTDFLTELANDQKKRCDWLDDQEGYIKQHGQRLKDTHKNALRQGNLNALRHEVQAESGKKVARIFCIC
jgi:hypothetical protein